MASVLAASTVVLFLMGPYVNFVDTGSARVVWVSGPGAPAGVVKVTAEGMSAEVEAVVTGIEGRPELLHVASVAGLQPFTQYDYEVWCGDQTAGGTFVTAPDRAASFRFIVYGDSRSKPERHLIVSKAMAAEKPAFIVNTGDLVRDGRDWGQWKPQFFDSGEPFLKKCAFWPVRGNHEEDAVLLRALFELPGNELCYSFDFGNVHFVVLDSYGGAEARPAMLEWLEKDLAANRDKWLFVSYHVPTFNMGGHGRHSKWGREDVLPLMENYGVDFVLAGHSHLYERFLPIGPAGRKPITHIVTGGGGARNYPALYSPILAGGVGRSGLHYCAFDVDGDRLEMVVKDPEGEVLDQLSLVKQDGGYQDEFMQLAVETQDAEKLQWLFYDLQLDFAEIPPAGRKARLALLAGHVPGGTELSIGPAEETRGWSVETQTTLVADGKVLFEATAPAKGFKPNLRLNYAVTLGGQIHEAKNVEVPLCMNAKNVMVPERESARIARAAGEIAVDGDLSDWVGIRPLPLTDGGGPGSLRLCWSDAGLYGALAVSDDSVTADPQKPYKGDCLQIFLDKEYDRAFIREWEAHSMFLFGPDPTTGPGRGLVKAAYGLGYKRHEEFPCAWQPTEGGYAAEFLIPARFLAPAHLEPGRKMGLTWTLFDDGKAAEEFYGQKDERAWQKPITWGVVQLSGGAQ